MENYIIFDFDPENYERNKALMPIISVCPMNHVPFICQNYSNCILATKLCNGVNDCGDNVDENTNMCKH